MEKQIEKMLSDGIIEPAQSTWSAPLLVVPKKASGFGIRKWRLVIDYRMLNNNNNTEGNLLFVRIIYR